MKIRWKFGELKWNHSNVRALTNKQTQRQTRMKLVPPFRGQDRAAVKSRGSVYATTHIRPLLMTFNVQKKKNLTHQLSKISLPWEGGGGPPLSYPPPTRSIRPSLCPPPPPPPRSTMLFNSLVPIKTHISTIIIALVIFRKETCK